MNTPLTRQPFPGLRPFAPDEADLFFGRDRQTDELIGRLARQRLLAVVGTSGSGKSSLVHAGLIPSLEAGLLAGGGTRWRMATMRPQSDPIGSLARALLTAGTPGLDHVGADAARAVLETTLRRSTRGLVEALRLMGLPPRENLLLFVDQFEELFRFADLARERGASDDAAAFVQLLLAGTAEAGLPLFVVLTMRSDFLGDCARFRGLPEAIGNGQYLVPRLTRDELRQAIVGPVGVCGASIDEGLVQSLLNAVGDDPDQLPTLQHALMCAWNERARVLGAAAAAPDARPLGLDDLEAVGGLAGALSRHASRVFEQALEPRLRDLAEQVFRCLTERVAGPRDVRRPTSMATLAAITRAAPEDVARVVDTFRAPDCSFLMPPPDVPLQPHTEIDISHESLIRGWKRLRLWVGEEWQSRSLYLRLLQDAQLHQQKRTSLWSGPALQEALAWRERERPSTAWADRYAPGLTLALDFLDASRAEADRQAALESARAEAEREAAARELQQAQELARLRDEQVREQQGARRRERRLFLVIGSAIAGLLLVTIWAWLYSREQAVLARAARDEAQNAQKALEGALAQVEQERQRADRAALLAEDRTNRMERIIVERITDPTLRAQLLAENVPGAARTLSYSQQKALEAEKRAQAARAASGVADASAPATARDPQPAGYKLWRNGSVLRVRFIGGSAEQRAAVQRAIQAWGEHVNLRFQTVSSGRAEIRVAFERSGIWAYQGTDVLGVPQEQPTLNVGWIDDPQAILEHVGNLIGLIPEHLNPQARLPWDREAVFRDLTGAPNFWDRRTVEQNLFATAKIADYRPFDPDSVMLKSFPGSWFTDGVARGGARQLSPGDRALARRLYPPT